MIRQYLPYPLIFAVLIALAQTGWMDPVDDWLRDQRFRHGSHVPSGQITLIDIDATSIDRLGAWPWKRRLYGELVDKLSELGVAEIYFDIDFSSPSFSEEDALFAAALERTQATVVMATFSQRANATSQALNTNQPISQFSELTWPATVNVFADSDTIVRSFPFGAMIEGEPVQSIPAVLAGHSGSVNGSFLVDFSIEAGLVDRISIADILMESVSSQRLAGRKVIIGASAAELKDFFAVPRFGIVSGHLLQAIAAETLIQNRQIVLSGSLAVLAAMALAGLLAYLIQRLCGWLMTQVLCAGTVLGLEAAATLLQVSTGYALQTAIPHLVVAAVSILAIVREIDLGKLLLVISESRADNTQTILDRVISDNFDAIVIVNGDGTIHRANAVASRFFQAVSAEAGKNTASNQDETFTGRPLADIAPHIMADRVVDAIAATKSGNWRPSTPQFLNQPFGDLGRRVLEYVITTSRLDGGFDLIGQRKPDRILACLNFRDITERRVAEERISYLARFDPVTGLANRNRFVEQLAERLAQRENLSVLPAIAGLSIERFHAVQEALGHDLADEILGLIAKRIEKGLGPDDLLATQGNGNFLIYIGALPDQSQVEALVERILADVCAPYFHAGQGAAVGASAGLTFVDPHSAATDLYLKHADAALNHARTAGGNSLCVFKPSMETRIRARQQMEFDLWRAFKEGEFEVHYQPQITLSDGRLCGAEALLRWTHSERGPVSPAEFIPVAEQSNLIVDLGQWVLEQSCLEAATWPGDLKVAVNLSPVQFLRGDLVKSVEKALEISQLSVGQLDLEITESLFIEDNARILDIMNTLRDMGLRFALDDFGTGYSSLGYIQTFPLDKIKIDQSFVRGLETNPQSLAIIRSVATLAKDLDLQTVAEGIETVEQQSLLKLAGCTYGQGYLYSRPVTAQAMRELIGRDARPAQSKRPDVPIKRSA